MWENKVNEQRVSMGGSEATRSFSQKTQKRMSVLEGRLDRVSDFNKLMTYCNDFITYYSTEIFYRRHSDSCKSVGLYMYIQNLSVGIFFRLCRDTILGSLKMLL